MIADIPIRSFFRFEARCLYRKTPPTVDGVLKDWPDEFRLPDLSEIGAAESFAEVYSAWNEEGLYFTVKVTGQAALEVDTSRPLRGDGLQIWIDTRDVRDAHRASRYCHYFYVLPGKGRRKALAGQMRIRRARAYGGLCDPDQLVSASRGSKSGYALEVHLPTGALTGFDPDENRRLGFTYLLKDRKLGRQCWTADDPLPVGYDPSLWGTLELVEP